MRAPDERVRIAYLAPWVDLGGTDKGTIDWFRWIDRDRFRPSLITTQPSANRRLAEVLPYAEEVWPLPDLMLGDGFPRFILDFVHMRGVEVVHVMNSRLGFNLLPDLYALPRRPAIVVQLHVEEEDRSGYVRYVTTRYGNLVDAFSVTSRQLAEAMIADYEVPRSKCHVIHTGVDTGREFSPDRVRPVEGLEQGPLHVLFPARLVEQKDPLLMVEVATRLHERGLDFRIHSVGDGHLEQPVRSALADRGLERNVLLHGPAAEMAPWFAACDVLLLTSTFEGVPYVVFEAMAMGLPTVAPALPGVEEVVGDECGVLVRPRDDAGAYAEAIRALASGAGSNGVGARARAIAEERFSIRGMAEGHERLYEQCVAEQRASRTGDDDFVEVRRWDLPAPAADGPLPARPSGGTPTVSVIVPCYQHGRYLPRCLESVRGQTYPAVETIVVDDASTDPETIEVLDRLEQDPDVVLLRMPANSGPSAARNAALERASGRYVLPLDADNLLLPDAIEKLVAQIEGAGERVGFIYPNVQYFGNRSDYFVVPDYNLYALMQGNYCDTCSLIDRSVFEAGARYAEDILLGHEDWDFFLQLAAAGIHGEPAVGKTFLNRKWGFTRSDLVEYSGEAFNVALRTRHPELYGNGRWRESHRTTSRIKGRWSPALSIVALARPVNREALERLCRRLREQSSADAELVVHWEEEVPPAEDGPSVRRLPADLAATPGAALAGALEAARGRFVLATSGTGSELLADRGFVEKVLRSFKPDTGLGAIAFVDTGDDRFPFRLLEAHETAARPHAVAWALPLADPALVGAEVAAADPIPDVVRRIAHREGLRFQWRHLPAPPDAWTGGEEPAAPVRLPARFGAPSERADRARRLTADPELPGLPPGAIRRWAGAVGWMPPETRPLCRHRELGGERRRVTNERIPPEGWAMEFDLGAVNRFPLAGTSLLEAVRGADGVDYRASATEPSAAEPSRDALELGYVEQAAFPLLEPLQLAFHPASGERVLVCGADDPLMGAVEPLATLGWIEPYPIKPRRAPPSDLPFELAGLFRVVDRGGRRHRYGAGSPPAGELAGELGGLHTVAQQGSIPVWITNGTIVTGRYAPAPRRATPRAALRWTLAPLSWRGFATRAVRLRAAGRRAGTSPGRLVRAGGSAPAPDGDPAGYLFPDDAPARVALYAAVHPVTGDQLLTTSQAEPGELGYVDTELLGYLVAGREAPGNQRIRRVSIPWASRFGLEARTS